METLISAAPTVLLLLLFLVLANIDSRLAKIAENTSGQRLATTDARDRSDLGRLLGQTF